MAEATIDYETKRIEDRPDYPPEPVGVAIKYKRMKRYMAWGHPTQNNCNKAEAMRVVKDIYREADSITFHNGAFDIYVGMWHMGLPFPAQWDDTLFLAYLHDPRDTSLALKPLADKYLEMPPDEQLELKEWILTNIPAAKKKPTTWGAYIADAPGKLVGKYAIGDVVRTESLKNYFMPYVQECDMLEAYEREKQIMPIVEEDMSAQGIKVAVQRLKKDTVKWTRIVADLDKRIRKKLKCGPDINLNSSVQLANVLDHAGLVDKWIMTEKGNRSTKRENLAKVCKDKDLLDMIAVKGQIETCITTFALPWIATAETTGGRIYPEFNQTRATDEYGKSGVGTKTGRFSSSHPNLQNVPKEFEDVPAKYLPLMPVMRDYLVPDDGCVFLIRDYSQQELRILAHYEDGILMQRYIENPRMDVHDLLQELIYEQSGMWYDRKPVKTTGFGIIYGMGLDKLMRAIKASSKDEAAILRNAYYKALPGVKQLSKALRKVADAGEPIRTWGGREYYCEEPRLINGQWRTFEYKLLNLLIQGSAADCTKQAMINYKERSKVGRITVQVHDELIVNAPKQHADREMRLLQEAMDSVQFDVPMLSDGKIGRISWHRAKKWRG